MPKKIGSISNPKLDLSAEIHTHELVQPPKGTPRTRYFIMQRNARTGELERPAWSVMRETEAEAERDARTACGLPADPPAPVVAPVVAPAGAPSTPA